jgi:hypothetical protein
VVASRSGPGTAYVTFDAHRRGEFAPYVFRTEDYGRTWTARVAGLPSGSVNVIAEHHANPRVLFLGTEHALYASNDAGQSWTRFMPNLPTTLYDDLEIHPRDNDLVLGTHGRSIWIMDNLTPLVEWSATVAAAPAHLFSVRPATIFQYWKDTSYRAHGAYAGENPPFGAILDYHLSRAAQRATITVANASGRVVRRLDVPGSPGVIHRVTWDLRHEPPASFGGGGGGGGPAQESPALPRLAQPVGPRGPFVSPGSYTVTLEADGARSSRQVVVKGDPMMPMLTDALYREREAFLVSVMELQERVRDLAQRAGVRGGGGFGPQPAVAPGDTLAALRSRIGGVLRGLGGLASDMNGSGVRPGTLYPPTETQKRRKAELEAELGAVTAAWERTPRR